MRRALPILALLLLCALPAFAADVLVVQASRAPVFAEALRGFHSTYKGTSVTVVLGDFAEVDVVRLVKEERPRAVLAVGDPALAACRKVRGVPVLSLMALSFNLARKASGRFGGVGLLPDPERYLDLCRSMGATRIGVVHDPSSSGHYLDKARSAAQRAGMTLVVREVRSPREAPARLEMLKGSVDALWMLPDATAVAAGNVEAWFRFSLEQRVPVVTYSERLLGLGAAASIEADRFEMGRQAGELAVSLLARDGSGDVMTVAPRKATVHANGSVLKNLGIALPAGGEPTLRVKP